MHGLRANDPTRQGRRRRPWSTAPRRNGSQGGHTTAETTAHGNRNSASHVGTDHPPHAGDHRRPGPKQTGRPW